MHVIRFKHTHGFHHLCMHILGMSLPESYALPITTAPHVQTSKNIAPDTNITPRRLGDSTQAEHVHKPDQKLRSQSQAERNITYGIGILLKIFTWLSGGSSGTHI